MLSKHPTESIEARRISEACMNGNTQRNVEGIKHSVTSHSGKYIFPTMAKPNFERAHLFDITDSNASLIENSFKKSLRIRIK
jgi:23S rRNA maturation-related 3'-5' exoribonuclease YhaM